MMCEIFMSPCRRFARIHASWDSTSRPLRLIRREAFPQPAHKNRRAGKPGPLLLPPHFDCGTCGPEGGCCGCWGCCFIWSRRLPPELAGPGAVGTVAEGLKIEP